MVSTPFVERMGRRPSKRRTAVLTRTGLLWVFGTLALVLLVLSAAPAQGGAPFPVASDGKPKAVLFWRSRNGSPVPQRVALIRTAPTRPQRR